MTVYVVIRSVTETIYNPSFDDDFDDDYNDYEITSEEFVGVYTTEEIAKKVVEIEDEKCSGYMDHAYYFPYKVKETLDEED